MKRLSIQIDEEQLHKLSSVAVHENRSKSSHIRILIRDSILAYEKEHGAITLDTNKQ